MDVSHLHRSVDIDSLAKWLQIQTNSGKAALKQKCAMWQPDFEKLKSLSYQFASVKQALEKDPEPILSILGSISTLEPKLDELLKSSSELEKESSGELLFLHHILTPLNFIPFVLSLWSSIRVYILPGLSLLMPVLVCILPYIFLRFVFNIPMDMNRYLVMIVCMFSGDTNVLLQPDSTLTLNDILDSFIKSITESPMKGVSKLAGIGMTVGQSVIQPYLTFKHLYSVNSILTDKSSIIQEFIKLYKTLSFELTIRGMEMPKEPFPSVSSDREHIAHIMLDPTPYKLALQHIGRLEAIIRLALSKDLSPVQWIDGPVQFNLKDTFDISVAEHNRKSFSINLESKRHHALLTGPNRGGKSTALRAICMSALLAHTYGCVIGNPVKMTPFYYMFASLHADDIPGSKSHFEREVDFASRTLQTDKPTLVFVDELFHTTNPPDALESCKLYCKQLWKQEHMISVISTHLFELVEQSPDTDVWKLCCPATQHPDRSVTYHYGLEQGICKVSSVYEILYKYGLCGAVEEELKKSPEGQE